MPAPVGPLQVLQAGREGTAGTLTAATHVVDIVPGSVTLNHTVDKIAVRNSGSWATSHRNPTGREAVELQWQEQATYDRLVTIGNLFIQPVSTGSGNPAATWSFTSPSDTSDNLESYSMEVGGKDTWPTEYLVAGLRGKSLSIDIKQDGLWTLDVGLIGKQVTTGTKTSALSLPSNSHGGGPPLVNVRGVETKLYIDGTTFGSTVQTGKFVSGTVNLNVGMNPRYTMDGIAYPYRVAQTDPREVSAEVVIEYDATTERTHWATGSNRLVRFEAVGPGLGSTTYLARLDVSGVWESRELGNDGNVITEQLTLRGQYNTGLAGELTMTLRNSITARP